MRVDCFDFELPAERIAQTPAEPRDSARLLAHDIELDSTQHRFVRDLPDLLRAGDLMVVNDTRVRHARLLGRRASGGAVELLLTERADLGRWSAIVRPAGKLRPGERIALEEGRLTATMVERLPAQREWLVELRAADDGALAEDRFLDSIGRAPLPPYIRRARADHEHLALDRERYQTIFAQRTGAIAAPTAGLHFTAELLERLRAAGVERTSVTLHVGAGTFQPVEAEDTDDHEMHTEWMEVGAQAALAIERCRQRGGRVLAVGTTSLRALESAADDSGCVHAGARKTQLFLVPGSPFRVVDALLTNFHLPRSTLLMLVSAFAGRERVLQLYDDAIARGYRFFSYGDAMLFTGRPPRGG